MLSPVVQGGVAPRQMSLLLIVFLVVFVDLLGFGIVLPLMPVYAKQFTAGLTRGQQVLILASLMTCFSLMQLIFAPLWGRVSDWMGRRPVLLVSLTGSTVFYALFGMATLWHSLFWMFVARIGAGIAGGHDPHGPGLHRRRHPTRKTRSGNGADRSGIWPWVHFGAGAWGFGANDGGGCRAQPLAGFCRRSLFSHSPGVGRGLAS